MTAPTKEHLAAAYDREWDEMQEHRTQVAQAHAMGAVPPDPPLSQMAKCAYVRPSWAKRGYVGE